MAPSSDIEDPTDLGEAGWGVIFAESTPPGVRHALEPLLKLRRAQAQDLYVELTHESGDTQQKFMTRIGVKPGSRAVPEKLPYYLLLVGDPAKMSFRFQAGLDVQYAVGRLHFDSENPRDDPDACEAYAAYAKAVVAVEDECKRRRKQISFFSVENPGDEGTRRLAGGLVDPLADVLRRSRPNWKTGVIASPESTRERLRRLLLGAQEEHPSILFTASHGVGLPIDNEAQARDQGAIICQDWGGQGVHLVRDHYFTGADVPDDADLTGLIVFQFSCYGAGTPQFDESGSSVAKEEITPRPIVSWLPQKLLERGALAVMGHVDQTWISSFSWNGEGGHVQVYSDLLKQLMDGQPIGWAMKVMGSYFGAQAASLHEMREDFPFSREEDCLLYDDLRRETNNARNLVVLGDPAVRLHLD